MVEPRVGLPAVSPSVVISLIPTEMLQKAYVLVSKMENLWGVIEWCESLWEEISHFIQKVGGKDRAELLQGGDV